MHDLDFSAEQEAKLKNIRYSVIDTLILKTR
jgi:hypothetical protein